ncbi:hypothetical protein LJC56_08605 [Christensenellaceae bacterium OttesenSCG-928-K19]|nr:hypothetical protein [Christensenellaceae bacterium OttesenSCG-928-K19]
MAGMSQSCFICGKPSVLFYDFLTEESASQTSHVSGTAYTRTTSMEKILGIARITLCKACLQDSLSRLIARHTNKNGKPRLLEGKIVEELWRIADEIDRGIYDKSHDRRTGLDREVAGLAKIFVTAFDALGRFPRFYLHNGNHLFSLDYIPIEKQTPDVKKLFQRSTIPGNIYFSEMPEDLKTPLIKRLVNPCMEPQYVLWTPGQESPAPFSDSIRPEFGGLISLNCMSFNQQGNVFDEASRTGIPSDIQKQRFAVYDFYRDHLMSL